MPALHLHADAAQVLRGEPRDRGRVHAQPQRAVQQLCKAAEEEYGSLDNITAVLVQI